ncbi:unnamed protein product [Leuciscus chuanchicus]
MASDRTEPVMQTFASSQINTSPAGWSMRANDTMEKDWEEMDHNVWKTSGKSGPDAVRTDEK